MVNSEKSMDRGRPHDSSMPGTATGGAGGAGRSLQVTKKSSWPGLAEGILHQLDGGEAALEHFAEHLGLSVVVSCGGNGV